MKKTLLFLTLLLLTACQAPPQPAAPAHARLLARASTLAPTRTPPPSAPTATAAPTHTPTATDSPTEVPTATALPTLAPTATQVVTPTASVPQVTVLEQANCRYGPGQAYLYSHGLYAGDTGLVDGRNYSGSWLWILPANLERHCWVSTVVVETAGDVKSAPVVQSRLPKSTLYGSPQSVEADRDGDQVTVTWEPVWMTEDDDRGYLIEATVCQNGARISVAVHTDKPSYTFTDGRDCSGDSGGRLYTVEKHGYTAPVPIPWP